MFQSDQEKTSSIKESAYKLSKQRINTARYSAKVVSK